MLFLDVGPTEFLLVAALFLVLFGADRVPDLARELGRINAQFRGFTKQFQDQLDAERGQAFKPGDMVPPAQKAQLASAEHEERARLQAAARALGIEPEGRSDEELRAAIQARLRETTGA